MFPSRDYIISKIHGITKYYSENPDLQIKLKSHDEQEITVEELVERYYKDPEDYFDLSNNNDTPPDDPSLSPSANKPNSASVNMNSGDVPEEATKSGEQNNSVQTDLSEEYLNKGKIASELQENYYDDVKSAQLDNQPKKLFETSKSNNLIYSSSSNGSYSHVSEQSQPIRTNTSMGTDPTVSVDEFFYDDPDTPWKPFPEHDLKQSPCYPIINIRRYHNYKIPFYYCKLHPDIENAYLESIEHHCKYKEPDIHKAEIMRLLSREGREGEG